MRALTLLPAFFAVFLLFGSGARAEEKLTPRYVIESIRVSGNKKTKTGVILRALKVRAGMALAVDDPRFVLSRYRVLSLGFFSDVRLRLERGSRRGRVVLVVEVAERGTILLTGLFFGTSEATAAWGGLGVAERNFLGLGIGLSGAFVLGADPKVERGQIQQGYLLSLSAPRFGERRFEFSASFLYVDGNEFFRKRGGEETSDPDNFLSILYRRIGVSVESGFDLARYARMRVAYRAEAVNSDVPAAAARETKGGQSAQPIDFSILRGDSLLSIISVHFERDTRSDPVTPASGGLLNIGVDLSTSLFGSRYDYVKLTASYRHYFTLRWGHVISPQVTGGVVFGEAPFFEKFFIGDYNDLVPSRVLGLNFSTLPSRDVFGTAIDSKRYEEFALRAGVEYIIPWFRGGKLIYSGDIFVNVGLIFMTSKDELRIRDRSLFEAIPTDLTVNVGVRLDTRVGVFHLSLGNALGRIPF